MKEIKIDTATAADASGIPASDVHDDGEPARESITDEEIKALFEDGIYPFDRLHAEGDAQNGKASEEASAGEAESGPAVGEAPSEGSPSADESAGEAAEGRKEETPLEAEDRLQEEKGTAEMELDRAPGAAEAQEGRACGKTCAEECGDCAGECHGADGFDGFPPFCGDGALSREEDIDGGEDCLDGDGKEQKEGARRGFCAGIVDRINAWRNRDDEEEEEEEDEDEEDEDAWECECMDCMDCPDWECNADMDDEEDEDFDGGEDEDEEGGECPWLREEPNCCLGAAGAALFASFASGSGCPLPGLAPGDAGFIAGPKGIVQSFGIQLAVSLASGEDAFKRRMHSAGFGIGGGASGVLYLAYGARRDSLERLARSIAAGAGIGADALQNLRFCAEEDGRLHAPELLERLAEKEKIIFIDGLGLRFGSHPTALEADMARELRRLADRRGVCIVVLMEAPSGLLLQAGGGRFGRSFGMPEDWRWQAVLAPRIAGLKSAVKALLPASWLSNLRFSVLASGELTKPRGVALERIDGVLKIAEK